MLRFGFVLILTAALAPAQNRAPSDAWLMQNYHFVPGPAPGEVRDESPAVARVDEVLQTTLSIMRRASHEGDYEAALAAAAQATAAAMLLGNLKGEIRPPQPPQPPPAPRPTAAPPAEKTGGTVVAEGFSAEGRERPAAAPPRQPLR